MPSTASSNPTQSSGLTPILHDDIRCHFKALCAGSGPGPATEADIIAQRDVFQAVLSILGLVTHQLTHDLTKPVRNSRQAMTRQRGTGPLDEHLSAARRKQSGAGLLCL